MNRPTTLAEGLATAAMRYPDRPALIAERTWSFTELARDADIVAGELHRLGLRAGDRVAMALPNSGRALVLLAGLARAGLAVVPFDDSVPAARLVAQAQDVSAKLLVVEEPRDGLLEVGCPVVTLRSLFGSAAAEADAPPVGRPDGTHEAYVVYTSGSTGVAKGVSVSHAAIAAHAAHAVDYFALHPGDRVLQFASLGFDVAQEEIWPTWFAGAAVVVKSVALPDSADLSAMVRESAVTVLQLPTAYWRTVTVELPAVSRGDFASVRLVVVGGEAAALTDLRRHLGSALGAAVLVNAYGPSESVVTSTAFRFDPGDELPVDESGLPIGTAFPGRRVSVVRSDGRPAASGEEGELYIHGLLADGYVGRPDLTADRFAPAGPPGPDRTPERRYRTGDLVRVLNSGDLVFTGRTDDQVKLRGFRIELGEVEAAIRSTGLVADAAAAVLSRSGAEPRLGALLVGAGGADTPDTALLAGRLASILPLPFVPTVWARADRIPLTSSGKTDRLAVAAEIGARLEAGAPADERQAGPPRDSNPRLSALGQIWCDVLGVDHARPEDDFLELGGDSLLAVRFAARARARGFVITPAEVLSCGTLAAIGAAAREAEQVSGPSDSPGPRTGEPAELLPSQLRWLLDGPIPEAHHFALTALMKIRHDVPDAALLDTATALLDQHPALSSRFDLAALLVRFDVREAKDVFHSVDLGDGDLAARLLEPAQKAQQELDPGNGEVFRMVRLRAGTDHRLLIVVHHLVLDGCSMSLLVDEAEAALTRWLATGRATLDPPTESVRSVRSAIGSYLVSDLARRDAAAWLSAPWSDVLPLSRREGPALLPSVVTVRSALTLSDSDAILHRLAPALFRPVDLLRAAIMTAVAEWTGTATVAMDVYDNNRTATVGDLDVSRTIGYLQSTHPEIGVVRGSGCDAVRSLLAAPRLVPTRPFGFDALRFLSPVEEERRMLAALPRPDLRLNYRSQLGRLEQRGSGDSLQNADEDTGAHRAESQSERYALMFEGDVIDGAFTVGTKFSTDHFDRADITALTARIAELCSLTAREVVA
ncbi:amino acid adenylation domain-containing protein [Streptosporangium sp. NPDC049644]|uniref:amino acid adenylation domain-containing protein n=1 Tax=Streptosporangium sp. NPDC049644 TaxID=3155507 RepID=UPI0034162829